MPGCYILAQLLKSEGKKYRYVAVCRSQVTPNRVIEVGVLKPCGKDHGKLFKISDENEKIVSF